jgi:hypothetical protein
MKTNETKMLGAIKTSLPLAAVLILLFSIAISHGAVLMGVAGAALFTISFCLRPDYFRSRRRSLTPAFCLLAFVWVGVAVLIVLSLLGRIE